MKPGIAELDACRVDPGKFDHAEHIRLGWLYLVEYGTHRGAARFRAALRRFTKSIGAEARYHETITCFFLAEIGRRIDGSDWHRFEATNADLFDARTLLRRHYAADVLDSTEARLRYVPPREDTSG